MERLSEKNDPQIMSFFGDYVRATTKELIKILGEPCYYEPEAIYEKTTREWRMITEDGIPFCLYDWKMYYEFSDDEAIFWHIGANNREDSRKVLVSLKKLSDMKY